MREVVIYQPWGGLGDNLAHSILPIYCSNRDIPCYLSNQNVCRNREIYDLVWAINPHITKTKDSTDMTWLDTPIQQEQNRHWNEVKNIQCRHGLEPIYHYPVIYYIPKQIPELANTTLIDLAAFSLYQHYQAFISLDNYTHMFKKIVADYTLENLVKISHGASYTVWPNLPIISDISLTYKITSLLQYCDAIFSCKNYICANSGNAVLASTIKNQYHTNTNIFVFNVEKLTPPTSFQGLIFKNTNYITIDTGRILERI